MDQSSRASGSGFSVGRRSKGRVGIVAVAVVSMLAGCFHTTVMATGAQPANAVERWQHFLIGGLVPLSEQWDARTDCPGGVAKVESSMQIGNVLLTAITVGIYASVTLKVWCAQGGSAAPGAAPSNRTIIVVPGSASLIRLRSEYPEFDQMVREQAAREDVQIAKLDSAAGVF